MTGIENSHIGNFRNFRHLVDNKLKIFKSKRLISGLFNYNYEPNYINNKLNLKVDLINSESLKKFIISNTCYNIRCDLHNVIFYNFN